MTFLCSADTLVRAMRKARTNVWGNGIGAIVFPAAILASDASLSRTGVSAPHPPRCGRTTVPLRTENRELRTPQ